MPNYYTGHCSESELQASQFLQKTNQALMKVSCGFLFPLNPVGTFLAEEKGVGFALILLCPIFLI